VIVTGPTRDLHSGKFGGGIHNPAHQVSQIIAALHDSEGRVQIPGFYDDVRILNHDARADLLALDEHTQQQHLTESGAPALWGVPEYAYIERVTAQPTCDVNGITSGYQGEGGKTIIPSWASFKVTMRLVPDQDPEDIAEKFRQFLSRFEVETLDMQVRMRAASPPAEILTEGPVIDAISEAFEATWGKRPLLERSGGTIAIISMFADALGIPITIPGYTSGDAIHSPNEYLHLEGFFRNIGTAIHVFHNLARLGASGE
jgi:acetylornithine deacetylase/succinyl-diaminopimelate desuccinylase-like protein